MSGGAASSGRAGRGSTPRPTGGSSANRGAADPTSGPRPPSGNGACRCGRAVAARRRGTRSSRRPRRASRTSCSTAIPRREREPRGATRHPPVGLDLGGGDGDHVEQHKLAREVVERSALVGEIVAVDGLEATLRRVRVPAQERVVDVDLHTHPAWEEVIRIEAVEDLVVDRIAAPRRRRLCRPLLAVRPPPEWGGGLGAPSSRQ